MADTEGTPQPEEKTVVTAKPVGNEPPAQFSEHFMGQAMQIMSANSYTPTQAQVDKMLSLQEKGMEFAHNERTHFSPTLISSLCVLAGIAVVLMGAFVFCVFYAPQYVSQILTGAFGLLSGGGIGYSIGNNKKVRRHDDD